jgi:microcystin-dependent protein
MDELMGTIKLFAGNFAPKGYLYCAGQLLPISQYQALFSLLGTTYGGDGRTTFALPDLRSRVPVGGGMGASPSLNNTTDLGAVGGEINHTLIATEIPQHTHGLAINNTNATQSVPTNGAVIATPGSMAGRDFSGTLGFNTSPVNTTLSPTSITPTGGNQPHNNLQPYLGMSYIICWNGVYPPRP